MERQNKLMAIDRFSSLANDIAYHIISLLSTEDLARLSLVSKRCTQLCVSSPSWTFDAMPYENNQSQRVQLMNFLDRLMLQRNGMDIQCLKRFVIRWSFLGSKDAGEAFRVLTWLRNVVAMNKVEVLDLELNLCGESNFALPICVFRCESMRSLTMNLHNGTLKLPCLAEFTNLQSLSLKFVRVVDESLGEIVSSSCKFLKTLWLEIFDGITNLNIKSSSLESFRIKNYKLCDRSEIRHINISGENLHEIYIIWRFQYSSGKSLKIFAPNLKAFVWAGNPTNENYLPMSKNIEKVLLLLTPLVDTRPVVFSEAFYGIARARVSCLADNTIKVLFDQGCLPTTFYGPQHLCLYLKGFSDNIVPALAALLGGMPNLKFLRVQTYSTPKNISEFGFDAAYWKYRDLTFIHQLEGAKIDLIRGGNELELVKYLLENGKNLKTMIITYLPPFPSHISKKVNEFKMASAAATVTFERRENRCKLGPK